MSVVLVVVAAASIAAWLYLLNARGRFHRTRTRTDAPPKRDPEGGPAVVAVIPARNEADVIERTLTSVLNQNHANLHVVLVDDQSDDGAADAARAAEQCGHGAQLTVIRAADRPEGWASKVWVMALGLQEADRAHPAVAFIWLTDADVAHDAVNLRRLIDIAETHDLDLMSQMVMLTARCF